MARPNPMAASVWVQKRCGIRLPVRPCDIARQIGIAVEYELLSPYISGCLLPEGVGRWVIVVNRRQSPERQHFTLAHELGHWVMHRYMRRQFVCGSRVSGLLEREANIFAAELLMPRVAVVELARRMAFTSLAAYFGVSLSAMDMRLRELGTMCA